MIANRLCLIAKRHKHTNSIDIYQILSRNSNNLSLGVVGLANVGKSTFFQAITKTKLGNAANYPFATIKPEESKIVVESERLDRLESLYASKKKVPTSLKIFDIAGLTRNASSGEGLGNQFLNDIRQVDGIFQVVRGFRDDEIIHIENKVNPVRDLVTVMDELILKDVEIIETGIEKLQRQFKKPNQQHDTIHKEINLLNEMQDLLYEGKKLTNFPFKDIESVEMIKKYNFLTIKPTVYLLNVNKQDFLNNDNEFITQIQQWIQDNCPNDKLMLMSAKHESDICDTNNINNEPSSLKGIIDQMRDSLNLISFFTCGPQEVREWTVKRGTTALNAASVIHNDLKNTFITALVYKYDQLKHLAQINESELKAKALQNKYGKSHVIQDGDIVLFKAGKGKR